MASVLKVGESFKSSYLDVLKHIQGDGVCESLAVLESSNVLGVESHWINGGDYDNTDSGITGNYECVHGVCCRVLGEVPKQYYLFPVWQYANRSVSLDGSFKIWKLPRKKYMDFMDVLQREGLDLVDYDVHLVDATKNSQYPDYTIEIGRHKSELTKEWRAAYVAKEFGDNLMDMMDVSIERRMTIEKWEELLFDRLGLVEPDGNELRHVDDGGTKMALPGEVPVNNALPPLESQAVPVVNREIEVQSRVDDKSVSELNSLLDNDTMGEGKIGLPLL